MKGCNVVRAVSTTARLCCTRGPQLCGCPVKIWLFHDSTWLQGGFSIFRTLYWNGHTSGTV